ncbi:hypothetical protein K1719_029072 [Acacia pycnantha]|nr:hypothetical protein K1719_029072 [Acacia pycnantha]
MMVIMAQKLVRWHPNFWAWHLHKWEEILGRDELHFASYCWCVDFHGCQQSQQRRSIVEAADSKIKEEPNHEGGRCAFGGRRTHGGAGGIVSADGGDCESQEGWRDTRGETGRIAMLWGPRRQPIAEAPAA